MEDHENGSETSVDESETTNPPSGKSEFDRLTEEKEALWNQLQERLTLEQLRSYAQEEEPEWERIQSIDARQAQLKGGHA